MITTEPQATEAIPVAVLDAASKAAVVELRQNGFTYDLDQIPTSWSQTFSVDDRERHDTPGPEWYERGPLRHAIASADFIVLVLYGETINPGETVSHASPELTRKIRLDLWDAMREGKKVLLIKTLWPSLAPWLANIQSHRRPQSLVRCCGTAGEFSIVSRAKARPRRGNSKVGTK